MYWLYWVAPAIIFFLLTLGNLDAIFPNRLFRRFPRLLSLVKRTNRYFPHLLLTILVYFIVSYETAIDQRITAWLGHDFTYLIYSMEGDVVARFQHAVMSEPLTIFFTSVYVIMYVVQIYFLIFWYIIKDDEKKVRMLAVGYFLNILLALPFYLFFPVNEVWTTNPQYTYLDYRPGFSTDTIWVFERYQSTQHALYQINGINNCFPSLHVSVVLTLALVPLLGKFEKTAKVFTMCVAIPVIISTMYLGIHWAMDVIAGIVLAFVCAYIAVNLDFDFTYPCTIKNVRWSGVRIRKPQSGR